MIGTVVFILAFVVVGLTVVLVAMRSGRRPSDAARGPSRGARQATFVGFGLAVAILAIAIPGLVLVANAHEQSKEGPNGIDLTNAQVTGRKLFARNCATCHTLAASNAVGRVGPNLDRLTPQGTPKELVLNAIQQGRAQGRGQMPAGLLAGQDAQDVADYVSRVAGR